MRSRWIALAVAFLAAVVVVVWVATRRARTPTVALEPRSEPVAGVTKADEPVQSSEPKRTAAATEPPRAETLAPTLLDSLGPTATVRARCIDEQERPIAGVKLTESGSVPLATSGADGRIDGQVLLAHGEPRSIQITLAEPFHLKFRASRVFGPGQICDLGDVVMPLGGRILGRVVLPNGRHGGVGSYIESTRATFEDWRIHGEPDSSAALTKPDGTFELDGVPAGPTRVSVRSSSFARCEVSPLEVMAGRELRDVEIRLTERGVDPRVEFVVRVLTPSGQPVPNARVREDIRDSAGGTLGTLRTDEHGICKPHCQPDASLRLRAIDSEHRYGAAYAFDVPASSRSLDMKLDEATARTLVVVDDKDKPVERFAWRILDDLQYRWHDTGAVMRDPHGVLMDMYLDSGSASFPSETTEHANHPDGRVDVFTPKLPFVVQVEADGFAIAELGPLDGSSTPAEIRVALQPLPGVRGRVVAAGDGVPNAWVKLFPVSGSDREITVHGFPSRVETPPLVETHTQSDGSFNLSLRDTGTFIVQAGDNSGRESEAAPLSIDPRVGAEGVELELQPLGAIDGRVLTGEGESARDIVVGASRGEGHPRSVRTDAEGRFRFEKLTPGRWLLRQLSQDIEPGDRESRISYEAPTDAQMPFTCEVRPGETARVEIDLRAKADLAFDIDLPAWADGKWSAWLESRGTSFGLPKRIGAVDLGELHIAAGQAGEYVLGVSVSGSNSSHSLSVIDNVHLDAGKNVWKLAVPCGEVTLVNKKSEAMYGYLQRDLGAARHANLSVHLQPLETRKVGGIPLGRWTRVHWDGGKAVEDDRVDVTTDRDARVEWN